MMKIRKNSIYIFSFSLFLSVNALSIFSYKVGSFDLRPIDFVILALVIFGSISLAKKNYIVPVHMPRLVAWAFLAHILMLAVYPVFGIIGISYFDLSLTLRWFSIFFLSGFLFLVCPNDRFFLIGLRDALMCAGILNAFYGVLMLAESVGMISAGVLPHHSLSEIFEWKTDHRMRIPALFAGPNQLGWYSLFVILISFGCLTDTRFSSIRGWSSLLVIHIFLLFMSTARTALIVFFAIIVGLLIFWFIIGVHRGLLRKIEIKIGTFVFISVILLIWVGSMFDVFRLSGLKNALLVLVYADSGLDGSANMRIKLWSDAYRIFEADHFPFGTFARPSIFTNTIDSGWVGYLVQGGPFLVSSFLCLGVGAVLQGAQLAVKNVKNGMALMLVSGGFALLVGMGTLTVFHYLSVTFLFLALVKLVGYRKQVTAG